MNKFSQNPIAPINFPQNNKWGLTFENILFFGIPYMLQEDGTPSDKLQDYFDEITEQSTCKNIDTQELATFIIDVLSGISEFLSTEDLETFIGESKDVMKTLIESPVKNNDIDELKHLLEKISETINGIGNNFGERLKNIPYGDEGEDFSDYIDIICNLADKAESEISSKDIITDEDIKMTALLGVNVLIIARSANTLRYGD